MQRHELGGEPGNPEAVVGTVAIVETAVAG